MALFPKIQSPCPYQDRLASVMDGDMCRMCKRQVFDLSAMSDGERVAFMQGCSGEVCVTYKLRLRPVLAAAAALAAAAIAAPTAAAACDTTNMTVVVTGGIKDPHNAQYVKDTSSDAAPELPVVYEAKAPSTARGATAAPARSSAAP